MNVAGMLSRTEISDYLEKHPDSMVRIGVTDVDGVLRGKFVSGERFLAGFEGGLSICDCLLGWDVADELYEHPEPASQVGWGFGYPDTPLRIIENSIRTVPDDDGPSAVWALCEFDDKYEALCPRSLLRRVVSRLENLGFHAKCGVEYEFTLFREDNRSLFDKQFQNLEPLSQGNFGYSILKTSEYSQLFREFSDNCARFGLPLDSLHTENGPGIWEAALGPSDPLQAADRAALFKVAAKQVAARHGMTACFMAKWSDEYQGQGGHLHLSLLDENDRPCFLDDDEPGRMSRRLLHFLGGQQQLMPSLAVLAAPTVNSYKRLVPGTWAPTYATWGTDNRTCALRVVGKSPSSMRVEYRLAGADANPYLALGAALGSGLFGLENSIQPTEPTVGNAYEGESDETRALPRDLAAGAGAFCNSAAAKSLYGGDFVRHFAMTRLAEHEKYARQVSNWEIARYMEII